MLGAGDTTWAQFVRRVQRFLGQIAAVSRLKLPSQTGNRHLSARWQLNVGIALMERLAIVNELLKTEWETGLGRAKNSLEDGS